MVDGVLYLLFPYYRVVALEPETGDFIWEYTAPGDWNSPEHQVHWTGGSMRGLAYWEGDDVTFPQIVFGTEEGELISLNAQTGIPNARFGNDGYVDLKTPDVMNGFPNMHYGDLVRGRRVQAFGVHRCPQRGRDGIEGAGGRRARVGSADGRARLDVSYRAPARRGRSRDLARRLLAQRQRRQHLVLLHRRRGAGHSVHAARVRPQRFLWRRPPRGQPLCELDRRRRCPDGDA